MLVASPAFPHESGELIRLDNLPVNRTQGGHFLGSCDSAGICIIIIGSENNDQRACRPKLNSFMCSCELL